jgi:hypothetical protein
LRRCSDLAGPALQRIEDTTADLHCDVRMSPIRRRRQDSEGAKALSIAAAQMLLARADEVIE